MGPIPWTVIHDYANAHELEPEDHQDFVFFIRQMDRAFLEWHAAQTPTPDGPKK